MQIWRLHGLSIIYPRLWASRSLWLVWPRGAYANDYSTDRPSLSNGCKGVDRVNKDEYRMGHAHQLVKAAMSELLRIKKLDAAAAEALRELYNVEDVLHQSIDAAERHSRYRELVGEGR